MFLFLALLLFLFITLENQGTNARLSSLVHSEIFEGYFYTNNMCLQATAHVSSAQGRGGGSSSCTHQCLDEVADTDGTTNRALQIHEPADGGNLFNMYIETEPSVDLGRDLGPGSKYRCSPRQDQSSGIAPDPHI
jgi:hypothetical protein